MCRWNNSPHWSNRNILPQPILYIFVIAADFVISQGRSVRQRLKKKKKILCLGVCVSLHREGYFYLTCKSLRAEIHGGLCRSRREQHSIFRLRLTPCNPLYAVTAEAALLRPSASRSICKACFFLMFPTILFVDERGIRLKYGSLCCFKLILCRRGWLGLAERAIFISAAKTEELFWGLFAIIRFQGKDWVVEGSGVQQMSLAAFE